MVKDIGDGKAAYGIASCVLASRSGNRYSRAGGFADALARRSFES